MNQFTGFEPDPDLYDPEDDEAAYGKWTYDDGTSRYGQGDAEEARALMARRAEPPEGIRRPDDTGPPEMLRRPNNEPPEMLRRPEETQLAVNIPKASRIAWVNNNPGNLVYVGQEGASKGEPKEGGGNWAAFETAEEGFQALRRQVQLDARRGLTLEQFIGKYAPPTDGNDTAGYTAGAARALGADPRTPVAKLDDDQLARFIARRESSTEVNGAGPPLAPVPGEPPRAPTSPLLQPPPGLAVSQVTQQGIPLSEEEILGRQQRTLDSTQSLIQARQAADQGRISGRQEVMDEVNRQSNERLRNATAQQQHNEMLKQKATEKIQNELYTPIQQVDPNRLIRNMSTGDMLLGALAVAFDAMGATVQRYYGNPNAKPIAMQVIDQSISDDIARQKDAIDRGERNSQNRVAHWTRVFNDADSGVKAATVEANEAIAMKLRASAMKTDQADIQAEMTNKAAELSAQGQALADQIRDKEAAKLQVQYAPPKLAPQPPSGPIAIGEHGRDAVTPQQKQALAREFQMLKPNEQYKQLQGIKNDSKNIDELKRARDELRALYKVQPDAQGNYPDEADYGTSAVGPLSGVNMAVGIPGIVNQRDRMIGKAWTQVKAAERMTWKAEPNGETAQRTFEGVLVPDRDTDTPIMLRALDDKIATMERTNQGAWSPQAWAYYSLQNPDPGDPKPVQGKVQR